MENDKMESKELFWKAEINGITDRIDKLKDEAVCLFESIKKELAAGMSNPPEVKSPDMVRAEGMPAAISGADGISGSAVQAPDGLDTSDPGAVRESLAPERPAVEGNRTGYSDGVVFEIAERKLLNDKATLGEKIAAVNRLFYDDTEKAVNFLYDFITNADMVIQRQTIAVLREIEHPGLVELYRRFITLEESSLRLQGIIGLVKIDGHEARHVVEAAVNDPNPRIRRFIANCLENTGMGSGLTAILRLTDDMDETVSRLAIRKLKLAGSQVALVNLVPKLENTNINIRKEAIEALRGITGTDLGYDHSAAASRRRAKVDRWKELVQKSYINPKLLDEMRKSAVTVPPGKKENKDKKKT